MTPEEILAHPPRVLTQAQRGHYFERGGYTSIYAAQSGKDKASEGMA